MAKSMKNKIYAGIKWVFTSLFIVNASRFITTVILARLLLPKMFGTIAIASVIIQSLDLMTEFGFGAAYIQRQESNEEADEIAANTTLCLTFMLNVVLFLLGIVLAPVIANFFKIEHLEKVLRTMFVLFLVYPFSNVATVILRKRLDYGKHSICEIITSFSYMVVSIPLALLNFGVWSLVFGYMTSKIVFMMMVVRMSGWSPRLKFDKKRAKKLFEYGKFIWGSNLVSTITNPMDKMLIGRFMGAANLGYYSIAYNLCRMPVTQISFLVNRIAFPALSKVQNDKARLMKGFMKSLSHVSIISLPIAFGLMAVAEKLVLCVYGNKWVQVIPLIKVIAFYGMTVSLSSLTTPFFDAVGKPNILLYAKILHYALKILLMFSFIRYGALGICYAILIPSLLSAIILFTLISTTHKFPLIKIAEPIFKAGLSSLVMFILIRIFQRYIGMISSFSDGTLLFSEIIIGIATYLLITFLINKTILIDFKNTLVEVVFAKSKQFYTRVGQL